LNDGWCYYYHYEEDDDEGWVRLPV